MTSGRYGCVSREGKWVVMTGKTGKRAYATMLLVRRRMVEAWEPSPSVSIDSNAFLIW